MMSFLCRNLLGIRAAYVLIPGSSEVVGGLVSGTPGDEVEIGGRSGVVIVRRKVLGVFLEVIIVWGGEGGIDGIKVDYDVINMESSIGMGLWWEELLWGTYCGGNQKVGILGEARVESF
ncbi:hypothetical protein Tco_1344505 [Tanacetum coccineum]